MADTKAVKQHGSVSGYRMLVASVNSVCLVGAAVLTNQLSSDLPVWLNVLLAAGAVLLTFVVTAVLVDAGPKKKKKKNGEPELPRLRGRNWLVQRTVLSIGCGAVLGAALSAIGVQILAF